jgi:hypothetical protein
VVAFAWLLKKLKSTFFQKFFFPNSMEKLASYLGYFFISFEKITFYAEILTRKVELWIFSLVSLVKKYHKTNFLVKFSVYKIIIYLLSTFEANKVASLN